MGGEGGPWYISNRPILLQNCSPGFSREKLPTARFPLWVALYGVPMELFTLEGLAHIASAIGVPLYLDKSTEHCRRIDVAKVCVEVARNDPLPSTIGMIIEEVGKIEITLDYPGNLRYVSDALVLGIILQIVKQNKHGNLLQKCLQECLLLEKSPCGTSC